ncbi:MAG TPA: hypothetical protein VML96_04635 [Egibacteraceae bacterium]|nr:hypothetical protein [Egibacteraceae bacterium]
MSTSYAPAAPSASGTRSVARVRLAFAAALSLALSMLVLATAAGVENRLGAPLYWPWLLTGLQVLALQAAGARRWWGWALGAAVQPAWIAYAVVTAQLGFIPGCAVSAAVQTYNFLSASSPSLSQRLSARPGRAETPSMKEQDR